MKRIILTLALAFYVCLGWSQNVGIGISTPISKLHVTGTGSLYSPDPTNVAAHQSGILTENRGVTGNQNAGIFAYATGSTTGNRGVFGAAGGTGTSFNIGVGGIADSISSGINYGLVGYAANGASNYAAGLYGKVQIQDGSQGLNKVFTSDASGTGTWTSFSTLGLLSGSGTLNYIPKFTPDGVTLGNSQLFDDGTRVGLGTVTNYAKLHVVGNGIIYAPPASSGIGISVEPGVLIEDYVSSGNFKTGFYAYTEGSTTINRGTFSVAGGTGVFNVGVQGEAIATTSGTNYGIIGEAIGGTNSRAGLFLGQVQVQDGTQGAGKVFTSDATGTGSWQGGKVSFRASGLPSTVIANNAFPTLKGWINIDYEEGGSNYTASTGVYTVPVTGLYHIDTKLLFGSSTSNTGFLNYIIYVNGAPREDNVNSMSNTASYNRITAVSELQLTAGDQLTLVPYNVTGVSQTILADSSAWIQTFALYLVH